MSKSLIKHVFPGGNTPQGFYSFYNYILSQEQGEKLIILKGGPGTGKSSFMKAIGKKFLDLQYKVEFHHCSSDPASIDALVVPDLKIGLMDGTAPHIVDPIYPGAMDEILYLGEYLNEQELRKQKSKIIQLKKQSSQHFQNAYCYLRAAEAIYENWMINEAIYLNNELYNKQTQFLLQKIFNSIPTTSLSCGERHLFSTGITPDGFIDFLPSILETCSTIYRIKDTPGASAQKLMNTIYQQATLNGLYLECYHSPIQVEKIDDILIPSLDIAITVSNKYHHASITPTDTIDLTSCIDKSKQPSMIQELEQDQQTFDDLLEKAIQYLKKAKTAHHKLEGCYIATMNFDPMNDLIESTFKKLLSISRINNDLD